jgi:hypothetical protein
MLWLKAARVVMHDELTRGRSGFRAIYSFIRSCKTGHIADDYTSASMHSSVLFRCLAELPPAMQAQRKRCGGCETAEERRM